MADVLAFRRPANADMVEGYLDGFDRNSPEPSDNRSRSYKHGFWNGRADRTQVSRGLTCEQLIEAAEEAMRMDELELAGNGMGLR